MTDELIWKSAADLGDLYRRREVSPVEVVEAVLDRMDHVQPILNIMVTATAEQARADAKEAEKRFTAGGRSSPRSSVCP